MKRIIEQIKTRGYWYINFHPPTEIKHRISERSECLELLRKSSVRLRGWDYPFVPRGDSDEARVFRGEDYVSGYTDTAGHREIWRFYQSANLLHYRCLSEDWWREDPWIGDYHKKIEPGCVLSVLSTVYLISEVFEFIRRLNSTVRFNDGLFIKISLIGIQNRQLMIFDPERVPLHDSYTAHVPEISWIKDNIAYDDLVQNSSQLARDVIYYIFETFNWTNIPKEVIEKDQQKFLQKH